jgi:hypothetical protein
VRFLVRSILAVSLIGALAAIGRRREARFAGIRLPGSPVAQALTIGTAMSAPPIMLAGLVISARGGRNDIVRLLSAIFLVGILGEPDTWSVVRRPRSDRLATACVILEIVLPAALLRESNRHAECRTAVRPN